MGRSSFVLRPCAPRDSASTSCGDQLPTWVRSRIEQNVADNTLRFERIKKIYEEFVEAFGDAGAEHVVIKGFAQSPDFVEHPRFRLQSDIDIYCPPESICRAREALSRARLLQRLGCQRLRSFAGHDSESAVGVARELLTIRRFPLGFELHFCFWNERTTPTSCPGGLDQFWYRRVYRRVDELRFPALDDLDNLGYTALNLTRNLFQEGTSPHQIHELARFLHTQADNEQFWERWREAH